MTNTQRQALLQSIAMTIADYRQDEIPLPTPEHVDRWVCQFSKFGFSDDEQLIILQEMDRILKSYYVSRQTATSIITRALTSQKIFGVSPGSVVPRLQFLRIQRKGNSQNELLALADEVTQAQYGISITACGSNCPIAYIYLDDGLYSGNTVLYDIKYWLPSISPGKTLHLIFLAAHTSGLRYLSRKLDIEAQDYDVSVDYRKWFELHNIPGNTERFDCFWTREIIGDQYVDDYVNDITQYCRGTTFTPRLFRPKNTPIQEMTFSSSAARDVIEHAFLKAGAYIVSLPSNPKKEIRPLGYEKLESLGFGAIFVTYQNIANNCPLVLWWGDPNAPADHPFSQWYPLFPRKVNEPSSNWGNLKTDEF